MLQGISKVFKDFESISEIFRLLRGFKGLSVPFLQILRSLRNFVHHTIRSA